MKRKSSFFYHEKRDVVYRRLDFLGFPNYRVGTDGSVWTKKIVGGRGNVGKYWRRRKLYDKDRYYSVVFHSPNGPKKYSVHVLVLMAFFGPCPKRMECRHFPDRNPKNNNLENLSWATHIVNLADRKIHGTMPIQPRGIHGKRSRFKTKHVLWIRKKYADGYSYEKIKHALFKRFNIIVNASTIRNVALRLKYVET